MTTENSHTTAPECARIPFSAKLQSAREALGLESKDAAAQLRLNERVILMLETDCYSTDIPPTFVRGYIRAYGKLLQIPENEIKEAIEPIKPQPMTQPKLPTTDETPTVASSHYFVQIFTYLVILTLITLVATWWYSHSTPTVVAENATPIAIRAIESQPAIAPVAIKSDSVSGAINAGVKLEEGTATYPTTAATATTAAVVPAKTTPPTTTVALSAPPKAIAAAAPKAKVAEDSEDESED